MIGYFCYSDDIQEKNSSENLGQSYMYVVNIRILILYVNDFKHNQINHLF